MAFIRQHMMAGDPFTGSRLISKRKGAGAGPQAKAARHRAVRNRRLMGDPFISPGAMASLAGAGIAKGPGVGAFLKGAAGGIKNFLGGVLGNPKLDPRSAEMIGKTMASIGKGAVASLQRRGAQPPDLGGLGILPGFDPGGTGGGGGFGRKRRTMNPANVKALRRSARRFEGFSKLIKTVNRSMPSGLKFNAPAVGSSKRTGKRKR